MRQFFVVAVLSIFIVFIGVTRVYAVGLGPYIELGSGGGDLDDDYSTYNVDTSSTGFGFVLDTSHRDSKVFNYRLNVGYEKHDIEFPAGGTIELDGLSIDNTFGFSVVRKKNVRFWLGPQISLAYYTGRHDNVDYSLAAFGIGPVLGVNFPMGPVATISLSGGFRLMGMQEQEITMITMTITLILLYQAGWVSSTCRYYSADRAHSLSRKGGATRVTPRWSPLYYSHHLINT